MKKQFLIAVVITSMVTFASTQLKAQTARSAIANTTQVNVTLADIISTTPGTAGSGVSKEEAEKNSAGAITETVNFSYTAPIDYANDQVIEKLKTITVMSSKGYKISVKAAPLQGPNFLPLSILRIKAKKSTDAAYASKEITLSTFDQILFPSEPGTGAAYYDVTYRIPKDEISKYVTKAAGTYTMTLYYTLETI